jgi:hypothetical protein
MRLPIRLLAGPLVIAWLGGAFISFGQTLAGKAEQIVEPDLTVSADYGTTRKLTTKLVSYDLLYPLREDDFRKMSLNDPVLQSAYIRLFLQSKGYFHESDLSEHNKAAVADLKRRGNSVTPLLLDLMKTNPYSNFEASVVLLIGHVPGIDPQPYVAYAREAMTTRYQTMNSTLAGGIAILLSEKGTEADRALLREVAMKRPYLKGVILSPDPVPTKKASDGSGATTLVPSDVKHRTDETRAAVPSQSQADVEPLTRRWFVWTLVVVAAIGLLWLLLKGRK